MAFVAIASGYQRLRKMAPLGRSKAALFTAYFGLRHGLPSYGAFRDLLQALDKDALAQAFGRWFTPQAQAGDWVAGDGRSPRSTVQGAQQASQRSVSVVSLYCPPMGLTLAVQDNTDQKTGTAVVTSRNDYVLPVKGNQPKISNSSCPYPERINFGTRGVR